MVTQDATVVAKVNKVKMKKLKKKKSKKKKMKNLDSESEVDKLDLDEKVYPLSHYISDQEELVNQMFLTIRGSKLEAMLPPVLKSIPLKELKRLCLHELRGMSKKRILCCINGQVMEGSSGSEDEEEEKEEANTDPKCNEANTKGEKRKPGDEEAPDAYLQKKIKVEPGLEDGTGSAEGKSILELLELEMRARIIKTMLEKGDEGKKITEDAIAAVMESAKKITTEGVEAAGGSKEAAGRAAESKDDSRDTDKEADGDGDVDERSRGRRGPSRRTGRRGRHDAAHDGRRTSGRSQKRDESYSDDGSRGRGSRKTRGSSSVSKRHVAKKRKITRKEFEERMKRAKKNRTYRQRKSSEDEEKTKEDGNGTENAKEDKDEKAEEQTDKKEDANAEGEGKQDKTEGEASEKEEGEIDSNEEEEGACSPSDISSASRYSSSRSSSRSWSRSYSRSPSRSPYGGRRRRNSRRTSRSRSRRRRRSYSRSYSRSRTPERRRRSFERRRSRDSPRGTTKKEAKKTSPDLSSAREEDWGHKCDIEFVDSEEDFDDNPDGAKKDSGAQKTLPVKRTERASISFSLQKKPVGITQNVDLDDLPLKKKQMSGMADVAADVEELTPVKPAVRNEEIVISSDSEVELQTSTQRSLTEPKADVKKPSGQQVLATSTSSSKLGGIKEREHPASKENTGVQSNKGKEPVEISDSEAKGEETSKTIVKESTEDPAKETHMEIDTQNANNKDAENGSEKQAVENENKPESKSPTKDSKDSESEKTDDPESVNSDHDTKDTQEYDTSHRNEQVGANSEKVTADSRESVSVGSAANGKDTNIGGLEEERIQDVDGEEENASCVPDVNVNDDGLRVKERRTTRGGIPTGTEQDSEKEDKENTEKELDVKGKSSVEEEDEEGKEEEEEDQKGQKTAESKQSKDKGVKRKTGDAFVCPETDEKMEESEKLTTSEQKDQPDGKEVCSIFAGQSEEEFYRGTEQLKFSEEEKNHEGINRREQKDKAMPEPLELEAGGSSRQAKTSQKIEMVMRERIWKRRDRKKRESAKEGLGKGRSGVLKSAEPEDAPDTPKESELEETEQNRKTQDAVERETRSDGPALTCDVEEVKEAACPSPKPELQEVTHDKAMSKIDQNTEIIGVIDTSKDVSDNFDDAEFGGSSWSMRWLQSEKVQKVVTSSKMLSRVRKKIQRKEKANKVVMAEKVEEAQKPAEPVVSVIGSIEEYERLVGTKVKKDEAAGGGGEGQDKAGEGQGADGSSQTQECESQAGNKGNPVFGSDDDGEDSEEEALWSKIIKK